MGGGCIQFNYISSFLPITTVLGFKMLEIKTYNVLFNCTKGSKVQCLEYTIFHRIIGTNKYLFNLQITNKNKCNLYQKTWVNWAYFFSLSLECNKSICWTSYHIIVNFIPRYVKSCLAILCTWGKLVLFIKGENYIKGTRISTWDPLV